MAFPTPGPSADKGPQENWNPVTKSEYDCHLNPETVGGKSFDHNRGPAQEIGETKSGCAHLPKGY